MITTSSKYDLQYGQLEVQQINIKSNISYQLTTESSITYDNIDNQGEQCKIQVIGDPQKELSFVYTKNDEQSLRSLQNIVEGQVKLVNRSPTYTDSSDIFIDGSNSIYNLQSQIFQKDVDSLGQYKYVGNTITISPGVNTIQTAISAASSGDIIYLQDGVYVINTIVSDLGKNLYFLGQSSNVEVQVQSSPLLQLFNLSGQYVTIKNIKFVQQVDNPNLVYTCINYNNVNGVLFITNCVFSSFKWSVTLSCKNCQIQNSQFFYTDETYATTLRCISINQLNDGKVIIKNNTFKAGDFAVSSSGLNLVWVSSSSLIKGILSVVGNQDTTTTADRIRSLVFFEAFSNVGNQIQLQVKDNVVKEEKNSIVLFYVTNINHLAYIKSIEISGKGLVAFDTSALGGSQQLPSILVDNIKYSNNTIFNNTISNTSYLSITEDGQISVRNNTIQSTIESKPFIWYQNYLLSLQ